MEDAPHHDKGRPDDVERQVVLNMQAAKPRFDLTSVSADTWKRENVVQPRQNGVDVAISALFAPADRRVLPDIEEIGLCFRGENDSTIGRQRDSTRPRKARFGLVA